MSAKADTPATGEKAASTSWTSPSGLDLDPRPPQTVRISGRTSMALVAVALVLLGLFAYGGWKRRQRQVAAFADANLPRSVAPATAAAADIEKDVPSGNVLAARPQAAGVLNAGQLQAPEDVPQTGQPANGLAGVSASAVYVRQAPPPPQPMYVNPQAPQVHDPSPEEKRIQAAYEAEQRAMIAPTKLQDGFTQTATAQSSGSPADSSMQLASALQTIAASKPSTPSPLVRSSTDSDPRLETAADTRTSFLAKARESGSDDYLRSTRTAPLSQYEIKAGWEIPAVMEQALNSELPGEVKALVTSNVYDTATGRYVLIPQGSRLIGGYNSQVGYGQDGVQVVWNRVIYPDGSSLDLNGMIGQDAHGFSGFRDKVDHHYKRLVGFAVLTSLFASASAISQNRSVLTYPTPAETASSAVGQQVSDLGAQITRKNLNVQPTINIPVGYRFNVRVNRDMLFDSPFVPS